MSFRTVIDNCLSIEGDILATAARILRLFLFLATAVLHTFFDTIMEKPLFLRVFPPVRTEKHCSTEKITSTTCFDLFCDGEEVCFSQLQFLSAS